MLSCENYILEPCTGRAAHEPDTNFDKQKRVGLTVQQAGPGWAAYCRVCRPTQDRIIEI